MTGSFRGYLGGETWERSPGSQAVTRAVLLKGGKSAGPDLQLLGIEEPGDRVPLIPTDSVTCLPTMSFIQNHTEARDLTA